MAEKEFTERELPDFSGLGDFAELPEDLRGMGPISTPEGFIPGMEMDMFATSYSTGGTYIPGVGVVDPFRQSITPIPGILSNQFNFSAINYLPRANFESFRSQRFYGGGTALLPPNSTTFVDLLVSSATITSTSPQKQTTGVLTVPSGFAAVITGLRQWVGDANAFDKSDGTVDDIVWRVLTGGTAIFNLGNFPLIVSSMDNEGKLFAIATESTTIQLSVKNNISPASALARDIAVKGVISGHWFPIDELDDIFRNR